MREFQDVFEEPKGGGQYDGPGVVSRTVRVDFTPRLYLGPSPMLLGKARYSGDASGSVLSLEYFPLILNLGLDPPIFVRKL